MKTEIKRLKTKTIMNIDLSEDDILNEVCDNHCDNPSLLFRIISDSTNSHELMTDVVLMIIKNFEECHIDNELERIQEAITKATTQ